MKHAILGRPFLTAPALPFTLFLSISCLLIALFAESICAQQPDESFQMIHAGPGLTLHKEMYMLPYTYSNRYHGAKTEAVFQLSAKHRLFRSRFYFGYTQISFWQAYDSKNSAPFRETNYNPELFYRTTLIPFRSGRLGADAGLEHESNGQKPPLSRSWNIAYICPYYLRSNLLLYLKFRYRIPEEEKKYPEASVGDDNPDIIDFYGYSDIHLYCKFWRSHIVHLMVRGNIGTGKGYASLNYSFPIPKGETSFVVLRISNGYGESLVDYNIPTTRIGIGFMFSR
jgi:phospholipase A1